MKLEPFTDIRRAPDGLSLPELKWRELVFTGAMRQERDEWQRDPRRPCPPFDPPDALPIGARFRIAEVADGRVRLVRVAVVRDMTGG